VGRAWKKRKHLPFSNPGRAADPRHQPQGASPAQTTTVAVQAQFSGPLPPPEVLVRYNQIEPGFANRIMALAEGQSQHRQHLERIVVEGNVKHEGRGQLYGFVIAMTTILSSGVLVYMGKTVEGLAGMLGTLAALAGIFVYGRRRKDKELSEKQQQQLQQ
jgi:uncharacterized membrane protein